MKIPVNLSLFYSNNIIQGVVTYLEIGSDTRVKTNIISSADRLEYAEVNHAQPPTSVKNEVGEFI